MTQPPPTARLMLRALRTFERELQRRLAADGFEDVSVAQTNVLRHLDPEGMRLGDLAADAGMTKQAVSQAAKVLEAHDLVRIEPDPDDGRAKRVLYARRGRALIERALVHVMDMEEEAKHQLGPRRYASLRKALGELGKEG